MSEVLDNSEPTAEVGGHRNYTGWICVAILVAFMMIAMATLAASGKPPRLSGHEADELLLKQVLSTESLEKTLGATMSNSVASSRETLSKTLDDPISGLVLEADKDLYASMLYAEMRTYQKRSIPPEHLALLANSKLPQDEAFYEIYTHPSLTRIQANQLISKLPNEPFAYVAAKVQALEKAGDTDAVARYVSPVACLGTVLVALGAWPFIGASLAVWIIFRRKLREGTLEFKGIPLDSITELDADRLAVRAAQILAIFAVIGYVLETIVEKLKIPLTGAEVAAIGGLLTILSIFLLQKVPVDGKKIRLSEMGLTTKNLGKDVLLGIAGFLAEFPVAMFLAEMSIALFRFLPKPTHPAEILEHTHNLRTIIPTVIFACVIAPFWEEIVFRGMLFPGLKRIMGGIIPGILLSSFIFASVHPQGIAEWLPLAFVGASSCYLSYQSRSLVPGMVMHSLHNGVLCLMLLLS